MAPAFSARLDADSAMSVGASFASVTVTVTVWSVERLAPSVARTITT